MSENDLLMRWLGFAEWEPLRPGKAVALYTVCDSLERAPDFRNSNEWAMAILVKLGQYNVLLSAFPKWADSKTGWTCGDESSLARQPSATPHDAIVEAALEIIRRESPKVDA